MVGREDFSEKGAFKLSPTSYVGVYQVRSGRELTGKKEQHLQGYFSGARDQFPLLRACMAPVGKPGEWGG